MSGIIRCLADSKDNMKGYGSTGNKKVDHAMDRAAKKHGPSGEGKMSPRHLAIGAKIHEGRIFKKQENAANPELHAAKNSMRRKGITGGKAFSLALAQTRHYNKKHGN